MTQTGLHWPCRANASPTGSYNYKDTARSIALYNTPDAYMNEVNKQFIHLACLPGRLSHYTKPLICMAVMVQVGYTIQNTRWFSD